jgi:hypothetical protein
VKAWKKFKMLKSTYFAIMTAGATALAFCPPVCVEPQPTAVPDFSIEKSCGMFAGHPRPLALCLSQETNYRGEVTGMWAKTPDPDRGKCAQLASLSERGKYQVLSRCLRAAISEASWKDAVGTIQAN